MNHFYHLILRIFHHLLASGITVSLSCPCKQKSQEIVYLSSSANSGTWVSVGGFLFDADNRTQPSDFVNIRSFHASKEIAGISRECFDISSLSLGIDSVEG